MGKKRERNNWASTSNSSTLGSPTASSFPQLEPYANVGPRSNLQKLATRDEARSMISQVDLSDLQSAVAPHLQGLITTKQEMIMSFERANEAVDKLLEIYQGRQSVVNGAKDVWEKEQAQAGRVQELETTMKCLIRAQNEDEEHHKIELAVLEEKVKAAEAAKDEVESHYKREYQARETELGKRQDALKKSQERAEKQQLDKEKAMQRELLEKEEKIKKNQEDLVRKLEKENADLRKQNQETATQLSQSQMSCEKTDRAYLDLSKELKSLHLRVEQMQQDTEIAEREDAYFIPYLERTREAIGEMCREHFTELSQYAIEDARYMSRKLEETTALFKGTPISDSFASLGLRRAKVFHLITALICEEIWQPLFISSLWNSPEIRSFLRSTSITLLETNPQRESFWRYTTLNAIARRHQSGTVPEAFLEHLIRKVTPKFRTLLPDSKVNAVKKDLKKILIDAIEFWEITQRDGSRVSVSTIPAQLETSWEEALPFVMPDEEDEFRKTLPPPSRSRRCNPLLVFPAVNRQSQRKGSAESNNDDLHGDEMSRVIFRGLALFPDTNIFDYGMEEQEALDEATKLAQSRVGHSRKRNSLTIRPETIPSLAKRADVADA